MAELLVVATPIGNLKDLSLRMKEALSDADLIAAEDTRVTMKLLHHLGLSKKLVSCHRHNEEKRAPELIARMLEEDLVVALVTDAGTPGISDPGVEMVRAALLAGIKVTPIAGPTALATALSASGFDARTFAFLGFPPREKKQLREKLLWMRESRIPVHVLYESPHRVVALVEQIGEILPGCHVSVCCDLTKKFELCLTGDCVDVLARMKGNPNVEKGEYVVILDLSMLAPVEAVPVKQSAEFTILAHMLDGDGLGEAAQKALEEGCPRNEVYRAKLKIQNRFE